MRAWLLGAATWGILISGLVAGTAGAQTCTALDVSASPASPQASGAIVTVSALAYTCTNPQYEFWLETNGSYSIVQAYSASSTYAWDTAGLAAGSYNFTVWVRQTGDEASYDVWDAFTDTLTGGSITPCTGVDVGTSPGSPQPSGTTVTLSALAYTCTNPEYEFWLETNGTFSIVQAYSSSSTYSWPTSGLAAGSYNFSVWVRQAGDGANYDAWDGFADTLTGASTTPCTGVDVSANPASPQSSGTTVAISGLAYTCPNPQYEFWLETNGTWSIVQAYSSSNSYAWSTTADAAGSYNFSVWVRDASSGANYDAWDQFSDTLTAASTTPCADAVLLPSVSSPEQVGTAVTFTASSSSCANPQYEFWLEQPDGSWAIVQDYGVSNTYAWTTTGDAAGVYDISVWARDASSDAAWDTWKDMGSYTLNGGTACTDATISPSVSSPQTVGSTVVFTGATATCGNPQYEFWEETPAGTWSIVQDYGDAGSFTWNSTGSAAGTYDFSVWVRSSGDTGQWESWEDVGSYVLNP